MAVRIVSLHLENIKSYRRQDIDFTSGVNAICGFNGSGKTTVLEAIGYALFDSLPYRQEDFIREGEKNGTIRVRLIAADDRLYEVVRKVGGGSYYVFDLDLGERVAERKENVLDWLRTSAFGLEGEVDLPALFENAVGVPQGTMTAHFLEKPTARKSIFDPLLRVEEYRRAYKELLDTVSYLKGLEQVTREEIRRLEGETQVLDSTLQKEAQTRVALAEAEVSRDALARALAQSSEHLAVYDGVWDRLQSLERMLVEQGGVVDRLTMLAEQQAGLVERARLAEAERRETEPAYGAVRAARETLRGLEEQRRQREALERQIEAVTGGLNNRQQHIHTLDEQVREAREAEAQAASLQEAVARQEALEARLNELRIALGEKPRLAADTRRIEGEMADLGKQIERLTAEMVAAEAAAQEAERLPGVQQQLTEIERTLAGHEPLRKQQEELLAQGKRLRQQWDEAEKGRKRHEELLAVIAQREPLAAQVEELEARFQTLRERQVAAKATLEYQEVARRELGQQHCPLLALQCPAVSANPAVLSRLDQQAATLTTQVATVDRDLKALEPQLREGRAAAVAMQKDRVQAAQFARSAEQAARLDEELTETRRRYAEYDEQLKGDSKLQEERSALQTEVTRLQGLVQKVSRLPHLVEGRDQAVEQRRQRQTALQELRERSQALEGQEREAREVTQDLAALHDPRSQRQGLLAIAARIEGLVEQVRREEEKLRDDMDRLKALIGQRQQYESLDGQIEECQSLIERHGADHDRHISARHEAEQLVERERALRETQAELASAIAEHGRLGRERDDVSGGYSKEQHDQLRGECNRLREDLGGVNARLQHLANELRELEEELAYLRRQGEKLRRHELELAEIDRTRGAVELCRDTINRAGPIVTGQLLRNISQTANDIFSELMDDYAAELRWTEDYDVVVQRGPEERHFAQLSGGEQMSAALALRLALLREMSAVDFAFFDEPTQNMDGERRANLADQIRAVRGFEQIIVISHDDTFEHHTDHLIRLRKEREETLLDAG